MKRAFTLIELSIVLIIIGLLVGGVLAGQELIRAAQVQAQIAQVNSVKLALQTFQLKYDELPGDIADDLAADFGFNARSGANGCGDGDGMLEGVGGGVARVGGCEGAQFWSDLADAGLVEGVYDAALGTGGPASIVSTNYEDYFPPAEIGGNASLIAWGGEKAPQNAYSTTKTISLTLLKPTQINTSGYLTINSNTDFVVDLERAFNIDNKIDDGLPLSGSVVTQYIGHSNAPVWANIDRMADPETVATSYSASTCIDNDGSGGTEHHYSLENATTVNCPISFRVR